QAAEVQCRLDAADAAGHDHRDHRDADVGRVPCGLDAATGAHEDVDTVVDRDRAGIAVRPRVRQTIGSHGSELGVVADDHQLDQFDVVLVGVGDESLHPDFAVHQV